MKKLISIMAATSVLLPAGTASAATKCVALNSSSTTCTAEDSGYNVTDWTATCTTGGTSVPISGIAICASTSGSAVGATTDSLTIANDGSSDTYCWCKMTSPAVSGWVLGNTTAYGPENCARICALNCSRYAAYDSAFRSALFSNLSD